ncbi:glutamine amidotransferase [Nordella sp. HKS 07]|uniref:DJ-1/PfpI family protein n=1 Tax=Nordella sp. HKS 07 TaxID=2712222 RepID=UPI0013E17775|nr:DJ-1/PfpI family protein [Nordella sp. HKS 07]QIG50611.1 glutamine amidotransferase [Nordella sp. HKS 07]
MAQDKTIGLIFIEGYADWEFGLLSASTGEWFPGRVVALSPGGKPVRSIGKLMLTPERDTAPDNNSDLDAVAVIGSDGWAQADAPDVAPLLKAVAARGGVIGGICAGTLALARAGLFAKAAHTSNDRGWIAGLVPDYQGREHYRDVPQAVVDGRIISAPGSAPGTFATEFLRALYPDEAEKVSEMKAMFAKEYTG